MSRVPFTASLLALLGGRHILPLISYTPPSMPSDPPARPILVDALCSLPPLFSPLVLLLLLRSLHPPHQCLLYILFHFIILVALMFLMLPPTFLLLMCLLPLMR
jgi:hypothetical protein